MKSGRIRAIWLHAFFWLLAAGALLSDFLSVNPPAAQNLSMFFAPPTQIHWMDADGRVHWRPHVHGYRLSDPLNVVYVEDPEVVYSLDFWVEGYPYRLLGLIPARIHLIASSKPAVFYPLGADELGRDVLARVLAGSRVSLFVVTAGSLIYFVLGALIGILAGMAGKWGDSLLMRLADFVLALPALYVILALRALLPENMPAWQGILLVTGTISAIAWPPMARGVRGLIRQVRSAAYVEAARSFGCSRRWLLMHHFAPAILPYLLQQTLVAAPIFLLGEVILSFLDVGTSASAISWGAMLRNLRDTRVLTDFWWNLLPLAVVALVLLSFNIATTYALRRHPARNVL